MVAFNPLVATKFVRPEGSVTLWYKKNGGSGSKMICGTFI